MSGRISEAHHSAAITRVLEIVPYAAAIREHVSEIVASPSFKGSRRGQEFLRHIIEKALKGQFDDLKERTLGVELFGRPPAYDTAEDAVVRVTACDVRKRLTHFYGESESSFEVRIDLPSGSYIPEFRRTASVISEVEIVHPVAPKATLGKAVSLPYPYRFLWAGMALALVFWLVVSSGFSFKPLAKRILPWSELLQGDRGVQLILSDPDIATVQDILATNFSLSDYANHRYLPERSLSPDMQLALRGYRGDNAATVDTIIALNIADLARPASQSVRIHTARSMKLPDFKVDDHFILLGSPRSNPWATLFEEQLDFVFEYDQVSNQEIIRNKRPAKGEPPSYIPTAKGGGTGKAYAIVGFAANPGQSGDALLLAGSNAEATEAAGRIATNLKALEATLRNCGIDSLRGTRHFELLLSVTTMAGSPNRFDVVVCHVLPSQQK
jgi:hypothetical protein